MLFDRGANVNAQGEYYNNALQAASEGGHEKVMQILLDKGADISVANADGWTPLNSVADSRHLEVIKLYLTTDQI